MVRIARIAGIVLLLAVFSSCNMSLLKKKSKLAPSEKLTQVVVTLNEAESTIRGTESHETELLYFEAFNIIDSLSTIYPEDSLLAALSFQVSDSYEGYLHRIAVLDADTLTQEELLLNIERLYALSDSAGFAVDSLQELRIPLVLNQKVEKAIKFFTETRKGRKVFERWLERAGKYETLVKGILREQGAPEELFYLAMIESGLRPHARSYARAVGMWQFIAATGRYYGLNQSWWYDERQDVIKSSRAAGRHLLDLYERFGDWYIGIAGYNFSPGKIAKRIQKYNVNEFWDLPRLPRQTRNYVPTYLAAVTIASDPVKYQFDHIIPEDPFAFDTVTVKQSIDLTVIADAVGITYQEIRDLNPAILRWCTPPDVDQWLLYLPAGTRDVFLSKYDGMPKSKKMDWVQHRIRSGQTLSGIASRYGVSVSEIKHFNKLRSNLIRAGRTLMIPIPAGQKSKAVAANKTTATKSQQQPIARKAAPKTTEKAVTSVPGRTRQIYTVRTGDSLWEVAQRFRVTITQLRQWNGLGYSNMIKPGQKLNVWLPAENEAGPAIASANLPGRSTSAVAAESPNQRSANRYVVRSGDTLWDIARSHNVSISDLKRWNGKRSNRIKPGESLIIAAE